MKKILTSLLLMLLAATSIGAQTPLLVSEGWDEESAVEVWKDSTVTWSIDWVEEYDNGAKVRTTYSATDYMRRLHVLTDWAVHMISSFKTSEPEIK